jgi:hypothetical protein
MGIQSSGGSSVLKCEIPGIPDPLMIAPQLSKDPDDRAPRDRDTHGYQT